MNVLCGYAKPWRVTLVDTGDQTMTGRRLKRVRKQLGNYTSYINIKNWIVPPYIHCNQVALKSKLVKFISEFSLGHTAEVALSWFCSLIV